jgi:hypothetical protein
VENDLRRRGERTEAHRRDREPRAMAIPATSPASRRQAGSDIDGTDGLAALWLRRDAVSPVAPMP